ncbi:MAG: PIN domain-containing protein [Fimbriimonadaceae bacterium]|nr:PIN domain-containing protein [Fimbriimonadaceae bacterium]
MRPAGHETNVVFIDTNILVYAFDADDAEKHIVADTIIRDLLLRNVLCLSTQVLNEFYWNITSVRRPQRLDHAVALRIIEDLIQQSRIVALTPSLTLEALRVLPVHTLSFWDSLIWAAAKAAGCSVVYSEDFQHGRVLEGVRFVNPFLASP